MKPSNFKANPMGSVLQKSEAETIARNIMVILARTGDTFRPLSWNEYRTERKKDGDFSEGEKSYFDVAIDYCKSPDTARLFSPVWEQAYLKAQSEPSTSTEHTAKEVGEKWIYDVIEKEGEIHILKESDPTLVIASIYSLPLDKEDYERAKLICQTPTLHADNKALRKENEELKTSFGDILELFENARTNTGIPFTILYKGKYEKAKEILNRLNK